MLQQLKSAAKFFIQPKKYAQGASYDTRLKFHSFFRNLHPKHDALRSQLLKDLNPEKKLKPIPEEKGFRKIDDLDPELVKKVHQAAKDLLKSYDLSKMHEASSNKHLVTVPLAQDADPNSPFVQLALHPSIIKMVGDYLGTLPVIENILFWYSPNKENFGRSSQYYHFDAQDVRTLQMLLLIDDVDTETGPFVLLEAHESEKLARAVDYKKSGVTKRIDDELVSSHSSSDKIHPIVGPAGSIYIVDSDRCFHYGSRKATKPRFILAVQYFSPYAFTVPVKWWNGLPLAKNPNLHRFNQVERLVLGAPQ